jgi:hypothetical protein
MKDARSAARHRRAFQREITRLLRLALFQAPELRPPFSVVSRFHCNHAVQRKAGSRFVRAQHERVQARQMVKVSGDQDVSRFSAKAIENPLRRVVGLKITCRREFRESIALAPEFLRSLLRAKLAAVPHDGGLYASRGTKRSQARNGLAAGRRQGTPRIDVGPDGVAMVDEHDQRAGFMSYHRLPSILQWSNIHDPSAAGSYSCAAS